MAGSKRIVVLDDDASVLRALERALKVHGFDTEVFNSTESFLDAADLETASCLILDVNLSGRCGIELKRNLTRSGVSIPVIFMTGAGNDATRKAALQAGCVAYLEKPFPSSVLIATIANID